jgi:hypothetical protein
MSNKGTVHSFQMDELYVEALVELLLFASSTAATLAKHEHSAGRGGDNVVKLTRMVNDANDILQLFKTSIDIGEPASNVLN